jgi:hypothetical protein
MMGYLRYIYAKRGVIAVATTYYLVIITFLTAYVHPTRAVTVTIDDYNEANIELAFMLLSLPSAASFILESLKKQETTTATGPNGPPPILQPPLPALETSPD